MILGQFEPVPFEKVADSICDPDRGSRTRFTFNHYAATLWLWVPSLLEDKLMRGMIVKGSGLHETYATCMGVDFLPDYAMRPCVRSALQYRYYDAQEGRWKSAGGKFTCDSYYRCFQEYTNAFQKHLVGDPLNRRMEIATNIFTPSPAEEKCIRETFIKTGDLFGSYSSCGCPDIFPQWPGAAEWISKSIANNPTLNLYWIIKDNYMLYTAGTVQPPDASVPKDGITPSVSPGLVDPDYASLLKETEELLKRSATIKNVAIIGGLALIFYMMRK